MAFYRMELLKIKDLSKIEKENMENEVNLLKKQNVVNANRVVVLEDELRNIQEGRDDGNTAEVIEQLQLENEDLKAQMERSLENMHKMSDSLKRKEESEVQLKKEVDDITLRELEVREELYSCRKAQELTVSDCAKLRDQVENMSAKNRNLQAKIKKQEKKNQVVRESNETQTEESRYSNERQENFSVVSEAKSIYSSQTKNSGRLEIPVSVDRSDLVSDPTPVAVNTVASKMQPPNPNSQAAFLSALESINNIIDMGSSNKSKTRKSESQSFVDQQNSPSVVFGMPPKADNSIFIPSSQDISVSEMQPYRPASALALTPQVTYEKVIPANAPPTRLTSRIISANAPPRFPKADIRGNTYPSRGQKKDEASSEGSAATFKNEIDEISLAYESIAQRPSHNIKNKRALLSNNARLSSKLTPFRLPEIPKFGDQRYDNDDEDILSTEISLKGDNILEEMPKRYVTIHSDPKKQQQDLNDTLFGMLSFLDSAEKNHSAQKNPPIEERNEPVEATMEDKSEEPYLSVGVALKVAVIDEKEKQVVETNEEERRRLANKIATNKEVSRAEVMNELPPIVNDVAQFTKEKEAAESMIEKLRANLEKSSVDIIHLEKQNLFIKQNYNDTVDILQKEAETNLRLKNESEAKYDKDISTLRDEKERRERALKQKLHEYESTLEIFEHAVASQNEVMTALVTKLELLQENEESYDEASRALASVIGVGTESSIKLPHNENDQPSTEGTSQMPVESSAPCPGGCLDSGVDEVHADFEVKDILLAEGKLASAIIIRDDIEFTIFFNNSNLNYRIVFQIIKCCRWYPNSCKRNHCHQ